MRFTCTGSFTVLFRTFICILYLVIQILWIFLHHLLYPMCMFRVSYFCVTLCFLFLTMWVLRHNNFAFFFSFYELCDVSNSHKYCQYLTYSCLSLVMVLLYHDLVWNGKVSYIIICKHTNLVSFWGLRSSGMLQCHYVGVSLSIIVNFSIPVQTGHGVHQFSCMMVIKSLSPWLKWLLCGVYHASPCSAEVKERVELYISVPLWSVTGRTSPFNQAHHSKKLKTSVILQWKLKLYCSYFLCHMFDVFYLHH